MYKSTCGQQRRVSEKKEKIGNRNLEMVMASHLKEWREEHDRIDMEIPQLREEVVKVEVSSYPGVGEGNNVFVVS